MDGGAGHGLLGHLRQGGVRRYGYERLQPRAAGPRLRVLRLYALDVGRYGVDCRHDGRYEERRSQYPGLCAAGGGRLLGRHGTRKPEHHGPDGLLGHGCLPRFHSGVYRRDLNAGDPPGRRDPLVHGRRFVAHDGFGIRRRAGDGLFLPGDRCDDLSGMVPPDHRRFRIRCRLHGHRPRDLGPDQYGQVHRGAADRCAGSADPRGQPGLSRGHDAVDPLYECAGSAGGLLRGRGEHLAQKETC